MKKQFIPILIIFMSIALLGIVAVQLFWIRNAIKVKEEQIDRSINSMLADVVDKIETNESISLISSLTTDTICNPITMKTFCKQSKIFKFSDTTDSSFSYSGDEMEINFCDTEAEVNGYDVFIKNDDESTEGSVNIRNTIINNDSAQTIIISEENDSMKIIIKQFVDNKKVKIDKLVNKMIYEVDISSKPALKRVDATQIDTLLKSALSNRGFDYKFDYAIYSEGKDSIQFSSDEFLVDKVAADYRINLFPNDLVLKDDFLLVDFPDKNNRIYSELSLMMGGSLIFTLTILIVFFITIRTIIRQKKLSDIKSDFINNMTHEFKTPIATISLAADSIENPATLSNKEQILHFTNVIKEENKRMDNQVENVLQMALVDKKSFELELKKVDSKPLIENAISNISLRLEKNKGTLTNELNAENHEVNIDSMHFTNIIFNLLDNACKYSNGKPEITLSTFNKDDKLYIKILDKGIGISKDNQYRIFEKFYRVSTGNIHNVKGHGLGLSYVKAITDSFGGEIQVDSELGQGSTFTLILSIN